jgi:hypothetical protein
VNAPARKYPTVAFAIDSTRVDAAVRLARAFVHVIRMRLSSEQLLEVRILNDEELDPCACHTFDFIDAERAMHDAARSIGLTPSSSTAFASDAERNHAANVEHAAWSLAKQARFSEAQL